MLAVLASAINKTSKYIKSFENNFFVRKNKKQKEKQNNKRFDDVPIQLLL